MNEWYGYAAKNGYRWADNTVLSHLGWVECPTCFLQTAHIWPSEYWPLVDWLSLGCPSLAMVIPVGDAHWGFIYSPLPCHRHAGSPK